MKYAFSVIPAPSLLVIPAQAGIQTGFFTAEKQRSRGVTWFKAPAAINQAPANSAAGAETQKPSLRSLRLAVNPAVTP